MTSPVFVGATAALCRYCGSSVLTWAPDRWLAMHEQVFKCGGCGRLHAGMPTMRDRPAMAPAGGPPRPRH